MATLKRFKKAQTIFYQGEPPHQAFRVKRGLVRSYIIHENGEEATIAFYGHGDVFPIATPFSISELALFYYEAVVDTVCESYESHDFVKMLERDAKHELHLFAKRYIGALLHVASLAQNTAKDKVTHTLRYLALRFGERLPDGKHYKISLRLTQHDLAKLCNISRETVSIELSALKASGLVSERLKHYVVQMDRLNSETGDDEATSIRL